MDIFFLFMKNDEFDYDDDTFLIDLDHSRQHCHNQSIAALPAAVSCSDDNLKCCNNSNFNQYAQDETENTLHRLEKRCVRISSNFQSGVQRRRQRPTIIRTTPNPFGEAKQLVLLLFLFFGNGFFTNNLIAGVGVVHGFAFLHRAASTVSTRSQFIITSTTPITWRIKSLPIVCARHRVVSLPYLNSALQNDDKSIQPSRTLTTTEKTTATETTITTSPTRQPPVVPPKPRRTTVAAAAQDGLSKFHQSMLARTRPGRQRLVLGRYPVVLQVTENPTRKWLGHASSTQLLVNGTLCERSVASWHESSQWMMPEQQPLKPPLQSQYRSTAVTDEEQQQEDESPLHNSFRMDLELLAEIFMERPGYVQILPTPPTPTGANTYENNQEEKLGLLKNQASNNHDSNRRETHDRLWVTGFWLAPRSSTRRGLVKFLDCSGDRINENDNGGSTDSQSIAPKPNKDWLLSRRKPRSLLSSSSSSLAFQIRSVNERTSRMLMWPNEIVSVPQTLFPLEKLRMRQQSQKKASESCFSSSSSSAHATSSQNAPINAILVCDGFLVPGRDHGGIYLVQNPGDPYLERAVSLTDDRAGVNQNNHIDNRRWFYHRATWVDLTNDGRLSILTARSKVFTRGGTLRQPTTSKNSHSQEDGSPFAPGSIMDGELVWLECPQPTSIDPETGTPLEADGTVFDPFSKRHLPWKMRVLAKGPDVMFCLADLDPTDNTTFEIISSQFFKRQVVVHSIQRGSMPRVIFERIIDDCCGAAFGAILAQLETSREMDRADFHPRVIDSGSTVTTSKPGDCFSHVLVTSHECTYVDTDQMVSGKTKANVAINGSGATAGAIVDLKSGSAEGGSLYAYRIPMGRDAWKREPWVRTTIASGFKVRGQIKNLINPGAPGFVYTFHSKVANACEEMNRRPMIAVAGDCAESAYLFRPDDDDMSNNETMSIERSTRYKLMAEIQCGATVGSIGVGYGCFGDVPQEDGFAKLYIPCYEKDKILVFGLGSCGEANL